MGKEKKKENGKPCHFCEEKSGNTKGKELENREAKSKGDESKQARVVEVKARKRNKSIKNDFKRRGGALGERYCYVIIRLRNCNHSRESDISKGD